MEKIPFSISEILDIAIQSEENGIDFYTKIAEKFKSSSLKEIFEFMIKEEKNHKKFFQKLFLSINSREPTGVFTDEYFSYLNAMVKERLFSNNSVIDVTANVKNKDDAVNIGIQAEKDSILFYEAFCDTLPEREKKFLLKIISEEKCHLRKLLVLKNSLKAEI